MNRRKYLSLLGAGVASTLAIGSGAFTSVSAQRGLTVQVAPDAQALLRLKELGAGDGPFGVGRSADNAADRVEFSFPGPGQDEEVGLGTDSVYEFDKDSKEPEEEDPESGLLQIQNQGTQPVEVFSRQQTESNLVIELYDVKDSDKKALRESPLVLDIGEFVNVGFRIRTFEAVPREDDYDVTLTIIAQKPEDSE